MDPDRTERQTPARTDSMYRRVNLRLDPDWTDSVNRDRKGRINAKTGSGYDGSVWDKDRIERIGSGYNGQHSRIRIGRISVEQGPDKTDRVRI